MSRAPVAILKSDDLSATARWYRGAGFEVRRDEPTLCEVTRDDLTLQFLTGATPWAGPAALTGCFYVHVPDVDDAAGRLSDVVVPRWGIEERDWGSRELVLQDPDGYFITFTTAVHPGHDGGDRTESSPTADTAGIPRGPHAGSSTSPAAPGQACWCCAGEFAEAGLIRLGARPEVAICLDCARQVKRRAVARSDEHRWTPLSAARQGIEKVRGTVIEHGWHERGPLGTLLRGVDRFLP